MAEKKDNILFEYDVSTRKSVAEEKINYGILYGNSKKLVFIKSGAGGRIRGKHNKYLKTAYRLRDRLGATVICADNPDSEPENIPKHQKADIKMISSVAAERKLTDFELYFIGTSDGAYHNIRLAKEFPQTVKLLGINPSMISLEDLAENLCALNGVEKILVYGSEDECLNEVSELRELVCNNLRLITVEGADHNFTGMTDDFIALTDMI